MGGVATAIGGQQAADALNAAAGSPVAQLLLGAPGQPLGGSTVGQATPYGGAQGVPQAPGGVPAIGAGQTTPYGMAGGSMYAGPTDNPAFNNFLNSTGYQFRLGQGMDAINSNAAAKGMLNSGATLKGLQSYGQGLGSQEFQNYFNQLGTMNNILGGTATAGQQQLGSNATAGTAGGGQAANAMIQGAANQGAAIMQGGNAMGAGISGALGGLGNFLGNAFGGATGSGGGSWF